VSVGRVVTPKFVGRDEELVALDDALERARGGEPAAVLVGGDAGIGKTRLVDEFASRAYASGARVLKGACVDLGEAVVPCLAIADALRDTPPEAISTIPSRLREHLAVLIPEAASAPGESEAATISTEATPPGPLAAVLRLLEELGRQSPHVLVIEDLHWADRSTLDVVNFLIRALRGTAVLVVVTYRADELHRRPDVLDLIAELQRSARVVALRLQPLDRAQTADQIGAALGERPKRNIVDRIHARSEGNPLFTEELLATEALPDTLRDALIARLHRMSEDAQAIARSAAAVGRSVPHTYLADLVALPEDELYCGLRECLSDQLLVRSRDGEGYEFRQALVQEVIYDELLPGELGPLHRRIAELQSAGASDGARELAEIAHHRHLAREPRKALAAAVDAARAAEVSGAHAEAARLWDRAVMAWPEVDDAKAVAGMDLAALLALAGEAHFQGLGDAAGAADLLDRALAELPGDAPPQRRADLLSRVAFASWHSTGQASAALAGLEEAVALVGDDASLERARVLARSATVLMLASRMREADDRAGDAVAVAGACGARVQEADALVTRFTCRGALGDMEGALALLEQARTVALGVGHPGPVQRMYTNAVFTLHGFGRYEEAIEIAREGMEVLARSGLNPHGQMCLQQNAASALGVLGRLDEAFELIGREEGAFSSDTMAVELVLAELERLRGRHDQSLELLGRLPTADRADPTVGLQIAALRADLALWKGDPQLAHEVALAGAAHLDPADAPLSAQLLAVAVRTQAALACAEPERAAEARAEAERLVEQVEELRAVAGGFPEVRAHGLAAHAELSRLAHVPDPGAWGAAASAWEELGRPYDIAYARWRQAEALAGRRGRRDEVADALAQAHEAASQVGATHLLAEIEPLARRSRIAIGDRSGEEVDVFPDLTPREREVLALVAAGRSNRQIASALFITDKTASVHVSNILSKLGVSSRGEAAARAHQVGFETRSLSAS
jgi:ATP/maltotriose-dependent transcriptional regulator MalT